MKATATTTTQVEPVIETTCCHHWLLGQPLNGVVPATCRKCGQRRGYPAVLDDLDPPAEADKKDIPEVTATAVGGARPSLVASQTEIAPAAGKPLRGSRSRAKANLSVV
jgi:hypothetical protein